jgi:Domain of unknown function (DUF397)
MHSPTFVHLAVPETTEDDASAYLDDRVVAIGHRVDGRVQMQQTTSGVPAAGLSGVTWRKSRRSNPSGNCVELAELPGGGIAVRNSRHPDGPALTYPRVEIAAFLQGAKDGEFDK